MSILGAIASAANGFRLLPLGLPAFDPLSDAAAHPPVPLDAVVAEAASTEPPDSSTTAAALPVVPRLLRPLTGALRAQSGEIAARQGAAVVRGAVLQQVGSLFQAGDAVPDLSSAFDNFVRGWQNLATDPNDAAGRQALINHGDTLAGVVRTLSEGVETLAGAMTDAVAAGVADLNQSLGDIHRCNRVIVTQTALGQSSGEAEAERDQLVAKVVEVTGANVFPRENNGVALFTTGGQALLDQRPTCFTTAEAGRGVEPQSKDGVLAEGRITDGRLGALLRLSADGSRQTPPSRATPDITSEVVRKLRSQLDTLAATLLGRSRPNQPTSFADAYETVRPTAVDQLNSGFFVGGDRRTLSVNPDLLDGIRTVKTSAAASAANALMAGNRQFFADGLAVAGNAGGFADTVTALWSRGSEAARRDAQVADAANDLMAAHRQTPTGAIDLQGEVTKLQTLQTALGTTSQIAHALGPLLGVLDQIAA